MLSAAANREFHIHGPQLLTLRQALVIYRQLIVPDKRLVTIPLPVMSVLDRVFMGGKLAPICRSCGCFAPLGEHGDPRPADKLPGAPTITVEAWCRAQLTSSGKNSTVP